MKNLFLKISVCAVLCASLVQAQEKSALETLRDSYAQFQSQLAAKYSGQQNALDAALLPRFDALEQNVQQKGDLDGVLAVRKARESLNQALNAKTPFELPDANMVELQQLFNEHKDARAAIADKQREENQTLTAKYAESLSNLRRKLVQEDRIDDAVAVQAEIDTLPAAETKPAAPVSIFQPQNQPEPVRPVVNEPARSTIDAAKLLTAEELAGNIQELAGKPVRFYARLMNMERDNDRRVYLVFDQGIRIRHDLPNLLPFFNSGRVRYDNFNLNQVYVFRIGYTFLIEATLSQTPAINNHTTFRNATLRGCNDQVARNYLKVSCQAPCPLARCQWCK